MPKPEEKGKKAQVEIIEDDLDTKDPQVNDDGIEIPLDNDGEPLSQEAIKKQEDDKKKEEEERHRKNAENAQRRIDQEKQKLRQQLEEKERRISELEKMPRQQFGFNNVPINRDKAYWEKRLADDPVAALDEYEEHKYQQRKRQESEMAERQKLSDTFLVTLEDSKNMALEEFPSLQDESSPEFTMFMEILDKNPTWRNSPIGPMKVVREMKKHLAKGETGDDIISKAKANGAIEERNRQNRIVNQPLSGRNVEKPNTIVLTKEQIETAKEMNIPLDKYAKMVKRMGREGGITI